MATGNFRAKADEKVDHCGGKVLGLVVPRDLDSLAVKLQSNQVSRWHGSTRAARLSMSEEITSQDRSRRQTCTRHRFLDAARLLSETLRHAFPLCTG